MRLGSRCKFMRIGIVCEGATDNHAIVSFVGASLESRGVKAVFVGLQPNMDRTSPNGGWGLILRWFENNPPASRVNTYFGQGLFDSGLSAKRCDAIVFQMDADNLSNEPFRNRMKNKYGLDIDDPDNPIERGNVVRSIIEMAGEFDQLIDNDRNRHIVAPAVESTETWCIAAFHDLDQDPELLQGHDLVQAFMAALHRSESRPLRPFAQIDKSSGRRLRFCSRHSNGFDRLERQCHHYLALVHSLEPSRK